MKNLRDGISFSWSFDGVSAPEPPKDNLRTICDADEMGYYQVSHPTLTCKGIVLGKPKNHIPPRWGQT
jgi:hypothetical protein